MTIDTALADFHDALAPHGPLIYVDRAGLLVRDRNPCDLAGEREISCPRHRLVRRHDWDAPTAS